MDTTYRTNNIRTVSRTCPQNQDTLAQNPLQHQSVHRTTQSLPHHL